MAKVAITEGVVMQRQVRIPAEAQELSACSEEWLRENLVCRCGTIALGVG